MASRRSWIAVSVVSYALNLGWEAGHSPLYPDCNLTFGRRARAAAGDAVMIIAVTAAGRPLRRRPVGRWLSPAAELTATAAAVELLALVMGRWSYSDAMPTVGTVGVSPLLQLPVTGTVALLVGRRCAMRSASFCLTSANTGP